MKTVQTSLTSAPDGKIHLKIPVEKTGHVYRVTVWVDDTPDTGWPTGYFESVIGKWEGEFISRSEGEFEERESL